MAKRILIVDDNEHLRQILSSILRFSGYEISEAATGTQAIEKAVSAKPNLILMDLDLPDMTGADAAKGYVKTKERPAYRLSVAAPILVWNGGK
jgi:CheY-like chemotaxis protein